MSLTTVIVIAGATPAHAAELADRSASNGYDDVRCRMAVTDADPFTEDTQIAVKCYTNRTLRAASGSGAMVWSMDLRTYCGIDGHTQSMAEIRLSAGGTGANPNVADNTWRSGFDLRQTDGACGVSTADRGDKGDCEMRVPNTYSYEFRCVVSTAFGSTQTGPQAGHSEFGANGSFNNYSASGAYASAALLARTYPTETWSAQPSDGYVIGSAEASWPQDWYPGQTENVEGTTACSEGQLIEFGASFDPDESLVRGQSRGMRLSLAQPVEGGGAIHRIVVKVWDDTDESDTVTISGADVAASYVAPLTLEPGVAFAIAPTTGGKFDGSQTFINSAGASAPKAIQAQCFLVGDEGNVAHVWAWQGVYGELTYPVDDPSYGEDFAACIEDAEFGLNPADWVPEALAATGCMLRVLFVPKDLSVHVDTLTGALDESFIGSAAETVEGIYSTMTTAAGTVGGCDGVAVTLPSEYGGHVLHPFSACGAMAPVAATMRGTVAAVLYLAAAVGLMRRLAKVAGVDMFDTEQQRRRA